MAVADEDGVQYDEFHGQRQLRVDLRAVTDAVLERALHRVPDSSLNGLSVNGQIITSTTGAPPTREVAADDYWLDTTALFGVAEWSLTSATSRSETNAVTHYSPGYVGWFEFHLDHRSSNSADIWGV